MMITPNSRWLGFIMLNYQGLQWGLASKGGKVSKQKKKKNEEEAEEEKQPQIEFVNSRQKPKMKNDCLIKHIQTKPKKKNFHDVKKTSATRFWC